MSPISMGSLADLLQGANDFAEEQRQTIIAWLRAHQGQHERAIAAGACIRGSTTHGELRDQAAYYAEVADALDANADGAWRFGFSHEKWLVPASGMEARRGETEGLDGNAATARPDAPPNQPTQHGDEG
jgi:hypothetical protein